MRIVIRLEPSTPSSPRRTRRGLLLAGLVVGLVASSGSAYAFWSASGTGSASITATNAVQLTIGAGGTPSVALFPGATSALNISVTNPNDYAVSLTKVMNVSATSSDQLNCAGGAYLSFPTGTQPGGPGFTLATPLRVEAKDTLQASVPGLVGMILNASDACQGQTFTVTLELSGTQV